jgi:hypothetical protein
LKTQVANLDIYNFFQLYLTKTGKKKRRKKRNIVLPGMTAPAKASPPHPRLTPLTNSVLLKETVQPGVNPH